MRKLTKEQARAIETLAMKIAMKRKAENPSFNEDDFFTGVMTTFFATESQARIPTPWLYLPQIGVRITSDRVDMDAIRREGIQGN